MTSVLACSAGGSSSGSRGGGPGAVSSIDSSKTAASLTEAEARQYCEDTLRFDKEQISDADTKKIGCGYSASLSASFTAKTDDEAKSKCTEAYNTCLAKPTDTADAGATKDPCATAKADLGDCAATLAELNACTADGASAVAALKNKDYCASATAKQGDAGTPSSALLYEEPASCKAVRTKCPKLADSNTTGG